MQTSLAKEDVVKPIRLTANRSRRQRGEPEPRDHQVALAAVGPSATLRPELLTYSLPALLGAWIGLRLYGQLNLAHFNKAVSATLLLAGIALTLKGL